MSDRPNILLVVFDSLSAQDLNQHLENLPTLQRLSEESLNFTNAYCCCPESSPARASLLTGLDIAVHGLWTDGVELPGHEKPLPEVFAANGYQSWLVGRRQLAGVSHWTTEHAHPQEYHHFDWAHGPLHRSRQNAYLTWLHSKALDDYSEIFPQQANPDDTRVPESQRQAMVDLPDELSFNSWVGQQVCDRIRETTPFFGVASFVVGQSMGASAVTLDRCNLRALQQADAALDAVLRAMPAKGVVLVTAARGSVKNEGVADPLQEAAIQVPLIYRAPGCPSQQIASVVGTIDVAATLYEAANIRPPQRLQGTSLTSGPSRDWSLSRLRHPDMSQQTALVAKGWKLIVTHSAAEATRLFDLRTDPQEQENLADNPSHQDQLDVMLDLMIDARVALEDRTEPRIATF